MSPILSLQFSMFLMIFVGLIIKKIGLIGDQGKKNLTDLVINIILPCNIVRSFMIDFSKDTLINFADIFIISLLIQAGCVVLGRLSYRRQPIERRKCLQYGFICSNAGFLGNPVAEGVFGSMGLAMASIYLIPQRVMMWSSGLAIFSGMTDKKSILKKVLTHPCIIACEVGLVFMFTQIQLPDFLDSTLNSLSSCNTALSMMVIGMILAEIKVKELADRELITYTIMRLVVIPAVILIPCYLLKLPELVTGVSVLLAGMPAGATTSILASKYHCDEKFATKLVVFSTAFSLISIPLWSMLLT